MQSQGTVYQWLLGRVRTAMSVAFWPLGGKAGCTGKVGGPVGVHSAQEDQALQLLGFKVLLLPNFRR